MAAHRYWRVYITAAIGVPHLDISEIEFRASIGGADQCAGGTAIYSGQTSGFEASKAFDNTTSTTWYVNQSSFPLPQWIGYDFGAGNGKDIVEFALTCWSSNEMAKDFQLQYSDDGSTWLTLYDRAGESWTTGQTKAFSTSNGPTANGYKSFWRVRSTAVDGGSIVGLSELRMMASAGGANLCTGGTAWASSQQESGGPPSEAFDGIAADSALGSYWSGISVAEWIGYQFPGAVDIQHIQIVARVTYQNQSPSSFVLEYWDGSAYQTAMSLTGITGWTSGQTRYFNSSGETTAPVPPPARTRLQVFVCT